MLPKHHSQINQVATGMKLCDEVLIRSCSSTCTALIRHDCSSQRAHLTVTYSCVVVHPLQDVHWLDGRHRHHAGIRDHVADFVCAHNDQTLPLGKLAQATCGLHELVAGHPWAQGEDGLSVA